MFLNMSNFKTKQKKVKKIVLNIDFKQKEKMVLFDYKSHKNKNNL